MKGQNTGVPVQADVPHGWRVLHYLDREQPWTLSRSLSYGNDRHKGDWRNWEVVRFCDSRGEAEHVSRLPL